MVMVRMAFSRESEEGVLRVMVMAAVVKGDGDGIGLVYNSTGVVIGWEFTSVMVKGMGKTKLVMVIVIKIIVVALLIKGDS